MRPLLTLISQCAQQFVRDSVLHVDGDGDEEATAAKRDLKECPVHHVIDRALNDAITDAVRDNVFEAPIEEDDKVGIFFRRVVTVLCSVVAVHTRSITPWCFRLVDSFLHVSQLL